MFSIAVVGCGYWGKNHVRNFYELGVLKYICDYDEKKAKETAKKFKVEYKAFSDLLSLDVDGVVIATPAVTHYTLTKSLINAGKNVFVEKPLSLKTSEANELCILANEKQTILMVGHLLQYHTGFLKLKEFVQKGKLGELQYIYSNRLNLGKFRNEENILWSFAPHDISMILSLANDVPESVFAIGVAYLNKSIYDVTTTHLTFKNGAHAHVFVSWLHPFKEQKMIVVGNEGMMVFDDGLDWSEKLKLYPHKVNWINGLPQPKKAEFKCIPIDSKEPLKAECEHFLDCLKNSKTPQTDGAEGLNVLRVLDASEESLSKGIKVNIKKSIKYV